MVLANNIPKTFGKNAVDPVGLAAVETGELKSASGFNHTAWHEIGHLLGLDYRTGGLMAEAGSSSSSVNNQQRGEIVDSQISLNEGNGTYKQSDRGNSYKKPIKYQIENFINSNGIKL